MHDVALLTEFTLASGRRADVIGIFPDGQLWIIEIKSSPADFLADGKWREYRDYCDIFSFAIPPEMDVDIIPGEAGLIVADTWGAEILRPALGHQLHPARRKALTLSFARAAACRLQSHWQSSFVL